MMYNVGSVCAILFTGPVNDLLGRRWGMFTGALLIIVSQFDMGFPTLSLRRILLTDILDRHLHPVRRTNHSSFGLEADFLSRATANHIPQFLGGRFVLGFGVSFCCVSAPTYVSELAHPKVCRILRITNEVLLTIRGIVERYPDWTVQLHVVRTPVDLSTSISPLKLTTKQARWSFHCRLGKQLPFWNSLSVFDDDSNCDQRLPTALLSSREMAAGVFLSGVNWSHQESLSLLCSSCQKV